MSKVGFRISLKRHGLKQRWTTLSIYDSLRVIKRPSDISQMRAAQGMMGRYSLICLLTMMCIPLSLYLVFICFPPQNISYLVSTWFQELQKEDLGIYP